MDDGGWKEGDTVGPDLRWDELDPMTRQIKVEEGILRKMLEGLKDQKENIYSNLLIKLIERELKDPRL